MHADSGSGSQLRASAIASQWNDVWPWWSILNFKAIHVSALIGYVMYGRAIEHASVWQASSVVRGHVDRTDFIDERGPGVIDHVLRCNAM